MTSNLSREDFKTAYAGLYDEARRLARRTLRSGIAPWRPGSTMGTTALVNETYLRLQQRDGFRWHDQGQFLALIARAMRFALVDYARAHSRAKRGGGLRPVPLTEALVTAEQPITDRLSAEVLQLDRAVERLAAHSDRLARVVECRFIVGLSIDETAAALGVSTMTIKRDWTSAKAFLARELRGEPASGNP